MRLFLRFLLMNTMVLYAGVYGAETLYGKVVNSEGIAIADARINDEGSNSTTWTNYEGAFLIELAPVHARHKRIPSTRNSQYWFATKGSGLQVHTSSQNHVTADLFTVTGRRAMTVTSGKQAPNPAAALSRNGIYLARLNKENTSGKKMALCSSSKYNLSSVSERVNGSGPVQKASLKKAKIVLSAAGYLNKSIFVDLSDIQNSTTHIFVLTSPFAIDTSDISAEPDSNGITMTQLGHIMLNDAPKEVYMEANHSKGRVEKFFYDANGQRINLAEYWSKVQSEKWETCGLYGTILCEEMQSLPDTSTLDVVVSFDYNRPTFESKPLSDAERQQLEDAKDAGYTKNLQAVEAIITRDFHKERLGLTRMKGTFTVAELKLLKYMDGIVSIVQYDIIRPPLQFG